MKITKVDKETKKTNFEKIAPIIGSGLSLGLTFFLIKSGVIDYNQLVDLEQIKETTSNLFGLKQLLDVSSFISRQDIGDIAFKILDFGVKTIGIQNMLLAKKSLNFTKTIADATIDKSKLEENPTIKKFKILVKGKKQAEENQTDENPKSPTKKVISKLISSGLKIGTKAYLIATHQIDFNNTFDFSALPHKLAHIAELAKNIDLNKVSLGLTTLGSLKDIKKTTSFSFKNIIKKIGKEGEYPSLPLFESKQNELSKQEQNIEKTQELEQALE